MSGVLYIAALIAALGCGLNAGVFFAFSSFVMGALRRLPPAQGIAAMQSINVLAVTPAFMMALFGTAAVCFGLGVWAVFSSDGWTTALVLTGCALYLIGTIGVTIACNVPLNDALAKLSPGDPGAASYWNGYIARWTAWNHVRAAAALAAATVLAIALRV